MSGVKMNRQVKGAAPTLISATQANLLIDFFNAFQSATISPAGFGVIHYAGDQVVFDLGPLVENLQTQLDQMKSDNDSLRSQLSVVTYALANATIVCNANGTITITFPGIVAQ